MLRKTCRRAAGPGGEARASMRPQRNAAENLLQKAELRSERLASMRPQRNAAENDPADHAGHNLVRASMRRSEEHTSELQSH